jgi:hypothetical protein
LDTFILGDHLYFFDLANCQNLFGAKCYADPAAFAAICMDLQTHNRDLLLSQKLSALSGTKIIRKNFQKALRLMAKYGILWMAKDTTSQGGNNNGGNDEGAGSRG